MKTIKLSLCLLLLMPCMALAQKLTIGDGNSIDDFETIKTKKLKLVCFRESGKSPSIGIMKGKERSNGTKVKIINAEKLLAKYKNKAKKFKDSNKKRFLAFKKRQKDIKKALKSCSSGAGDDDDENTPNPGPAARSLGTNLYWMGANSSQILYVNAMKRATRWFPNVVPYNNSFDSGVDVPMREDGYPTHVPFTAENNQHNVMSFIFNDMDGHYPAGTYTFSFEGTGSLLISGDTPDLLLTTAGTHQVPVTPGANGITIEINESSSSDPIRNMKFLLPGFSDSQKFNPSLINALRGFSTLRMSNPQEVNGATYPCSDGVDPASTSCVREWSDRVMQTDRTYALGAGMPLEDIIELTNEVGADLWIHVHHGSTDEHIENMATLIRENLNSHLKVYVEYSNEVWNSDGPYLSQRTYSTQRGIELGFDSNEDRAREKFITHMTCKAGNIFDTVFGSDKSRVKIVMPAFNADPEATARQLAAQNDSNVCLSGRRADALAMASYFGGEIPGQIIGNSEQNTITVEQILTRARQNISENIPDPLAPEENSYSLSYFINAQCAVASEYNIPLVAYEGGQHIIEMRGFDNDETLGNKLIQVNAHEDMEDAFSEVFEAWYGACGGLFNIYTYIQKDSIYFGMFGAMTDMYDSSGNLRTMSELESDFPKLKAVRDELRSNQQL